MSIQSTLTQAIEVIFILFIALMIFDFIDGLYIVPLPPMISIAQSKVVSETTALVLAPHFEPISNPCSPEVEAQQINVIAPQFESIPDPWTLELDSLNSTIEIESILLPLSVLRLLPPVEEVQPKPKRTKTTKKAASTCKSPRKPGRPRQKAA